MLLGLTLLCPVRVASSVPVFVAHMRSVPSADAETSCVPSGENEIELQIELSGCVRALNVSSIAPAARHSNWVDESQCMTRKRT